MRSVGRTVFVCGNLQTLTTRYCGGMFIPLSTIKACTSGTLASPPPVGGMLCGHHAPGHQSSFSFQKMLRTLCTLHVALVPERCEVNYSANLLSQTFGPTASLFLCARPFSGSFLSSSTTTCVMGNFIARQKGICRCTMLQTKWDTQPLPGIWSSCFVICHASCPDNHTATVREVLTQTFEYRDLIGKQHVHYGAFHLQASRLLWLLGFPPELSPVA